MLPGFGLEISWKGSPFLGEIFSFSRRKTFISCPGSAEKLQAFDLIREDGKKEVLGRPNLYVTTDYFLDYMGINHLEELPVIDELEIQAQESQLFGERIEEDENQ